jgi:DnaA family protein
MPRQLALDLLQPPAPSFGNFVSGRNREAVQALQRLAAGELPERIVYLWGGPGSGRSHLLAALRAAGAFELRSRDEATQPGLAVVDDVDLLDDALLAALFLRLDAARLQPGVACAAAGPAAPARLALREDVRTRLGWGLVYPLHALTDAEKAQALAAQAAARGVTVGDDLIPYLLAHLPRDMRTLAAALDALDAYALARRRALTAALAREWLQRRAS